MLVVGVWSSALGSCLLALGHWSCFLAFDFGHLIFRHWSLCIGSSSSVLGGRGLVFWRGPPARVMGRHLEVHCRDLSLIALHKRKWRLVSHRRLMGAELPLAKLCASPSSKNLNGAFCPMFYGFLETMRFDAHSLVFTARCLARSFPRCGWSRWCVVAKVVAIVVWLSS